MQGADCYVHEIQTGRILLTYSNYIFTVFDNYRIKNIGKLYALGTPSKLGAIPQSITNLIEVRILSINHNGSEIQYDVTFTYNILY
jgi:hypothetical protein